MTDALNFDNFNDIQNVKVDPFNSTKNITAGNNFLNLNGIVAKLGFIILIMFLFFILLRIGTELLGNYFQPSNNPILLNGLKDGTLFALVPVNPNEPNAIPIIRSVDQTKGLEFTWSSWLYFKEPATGLGSSNLWNHIYNKGSNFRNDSTGMMSPNNAPGVYISSDYRKLAIVMSTYDNPNNKIIINDLPIGHWINVIIRVIQHKLDVIINGILTESVILEDIPNQNYDPVYMGLHNGFSGYLSQLQYFAYALDTPQIQKILKTGPNLTSSSGNNINLTDSNYLSFRWHFPLQSSEMQ
jgi:hypothetical protein